MLRDLIRGRRRLSRALKAAAEAHHGAEARLIEHHWADWYAAFIVAQEHGFSEAAAVASADDYINLRKKGARLCARTAAR